MSAYTLKNFDAQDESVTIAYTVNKNCAIEKAYKFHTGAPKNADTKVSIFKQVVNDEGFVLRMQDKKKDSYIEINGCVPALQKFFAIEQDSDGLAELFLKNTMTTRVSLSAFKPQRPHKNKYARK